MPHDHVLLAAAAVYDEHNWGRGGNFNAAQDAYCVDGALRYAVSGDPLEPGEGEQYELYLAACSTLAEVIREDYPNAPSRIRRSHIAWNDSNAYGPQTKAEVKRKLKKAATRARKEHERGRL